MIVHEETPQVTGEDHPAPICCHYWIIETASGPVSRGECQICHEVRDFRNSVFDMDRDSQDSRSRKASEVEEKTPKVAALQMTQELTQELNQEPDGEELDTEAHDTEDKEAEKPEVEEPEFAGVLED